jgi:hypothetical protein
MACDTPFHLKRIFLIDGRHLIDASVTSGAANAFCHVNTVIEVHELRKIMNPLPLDRFVFAKARPDRFKIWAVIPQLAVTVHACLGRRHTRRRSCLDRGVAIAAINAVIADVVFMTELDRLLLFEELTCQVRRSCYLGVYVKRYSGKYNNHHHAYPGYVVCTSVKELRHLLLSRS